MEVGTEKAAARRAVVENRSAKKDMLVSKLIFKSTIEKITASICVRYGENRDNQKFCPVVIPSSVFRI
jgi:hypothetical protein